MNYDKAYLESLIYKKIEESSNLDYKAPDALSRADAKKAEITKDVSAFANSAGGKIIYGIREYSDDARKHLPEKIDPVNQAEYSKEWLDQIISQIQPPIDGVKIIPIHVGPNASDFCFLVEIPQSGTAHQAKDLRYYKRRNFKSDPMEDYEIRDIMNRRKIPDVQAKVRITENNKNKYLSVRFENKSNILVRHFSAVLKIPFLFPAGLVNFPEGVLEEANNESYWLVSLNNEGGSVLFPRGELILSTQYYEDFDLFHNGLKHSIEGISIEVFADEMKSIIRFKDLNVAHFDWV